MADELKIMQVNTGTTSGWENQARPMRVGELGFDSEKEKGKFGDGTSSFEDLDGLAKDSEVAAVKTELEGKIAEAKESADTYQGTPHKVATVPTATTLTVSGDATADFPVSTKLKINGKTTTVTASAYTTVTTITVDKAVLAAGDVGQVVAVAVGYVPLVDTRPAGFMDWFCGTAAPDGYLVANGAAISRTAYADLFAAIGTKFGAGNGSTTFNLPDLRNEFVRGYTGTASNVGAKQGDAMQPIVGSFSSNNAVGSALNATAMYGPFGLGATPKAIRYSTQTDSNKSYDITFNSSAVVRTADETRPRNIALLPCIKY